MSTYAITNSEKITPSTLLLTLKRKSGEPLLFQPGQYAAIHGFRRGRPMPIRCFSIVSSPTEQDVLQFSMRVRGRFTRATAELRIGQDVHVQGPYGGFVLNTNQQKHIVMLAGGIGITPFMSMIRFASITQAATDIDLLYSVASQDDIPFGAELLQWRLRNQRFRPYFVVDQGATDKLPLNNTVTGRITPDLVEGISGPAYGSGETVFYICGPPPFMRGMLAMLQKRGVPKSHIMTEAFSQGPNRQTGKMRDWPFSMYTLGALGLSAGSMAIMIADLRSILPPDDTVASSSKLTNSLSNNRQTDLDALINNLPAPSATAPASPNVKTALAAAHQTDTSNSSSRTSSSSSSSSSSSNSTTTTSTPASTPTCYTTQSGVTQCY